ncbi:MAG: hypothetical protein M1820_004098 [Bogoriella megaspora]|nr:MAG: hypothetical protein M1820_004098 [Bogoriella megaspora]
MPANSAKDNGFLTFNRQVTERFDVTYLPFGEGGRAYRSKVQELHHDLELGESYAIIAYGDPAAVVLDVAHKPMRHLCALIAFYPSTITHPKAKFPPHVEYQVHLASNQRGQIEEPTSLPVYWYPDTQAGFAEEDLDEWDNVASGLAWTRTLGAVRKAFKIDVELENIHELNQAMKLSRKDAAGTVQTLSPEAYVNCIPTMTGGLGTKELFYFYQNFFISANSPSFKWRLVSRTIGTDRVVDELFISFKHTQEMPWILPDVPPTNKNVEVALVSIVCIRGDKVYQEHMYWDQGTVLVQIGLLDPKLVPREMKAKGLKKLPVNGAESAQKVLDEEVPSNELLSKWNPPTQQNGSMKSTRMPVR